jgi:hypothetical protein
MKGPLGDVVVLAVLRSRRTVYSVVWRSSCDTTGGAAGPYVLPVQYARVGRRLVVVPQRAESTTWWRKLSHPTAGAPTAQGPAA